MLALLGKALPWWVVCAGDCAWQKSWSWRSTHKSFALSSFKNLAQTLKMSRADDGQGQFEWGKVGKGATSLGSG